MTTKIIKLLLVCFLTIIVAPQLSADDNKEYESTRKERNHIREGNKLFEEKRYAEAEVEFRKALQENQSSEIGMFNLANTLIQIGGNNNTKADNQNNPTAEAASLLNDIASITHNPDLKAKALYNLGNLAFNNEQYPQAVQLYRRSLRANPDDMDCRQNLRLAQLKMQNQDQNQNQDKKEDKKEEKKEEQKEDKNQQQPQQPQQKNKDQQPPQQKSGAISAENAQQILKAMQNNENATQKKVNASRAEKEQSERQRTRNQW